LDNERSPENYESVEMCINSVKYVYGRPANGRWSRQSIAKFVV